MFRLIEKLTMPRTRRLSPTNCVRVISSASPKPMQFITEINDDQISVTLEDGSEINIEWVPQYVARRIPDSLEYWIFLSLSKRRSDHLLMRSKSNAGSVSNMVTQWFWKLGTVWSPMDRASFVMEGFGVSCANSSQGCPDVRKRFGRVTKRFSRSSGRSELSQGCPDCDVIWGAFRNLARVVRE